jgi:hypothetical protein
MDLDTVTDELYAGGLEDFMPQRTALARAARDEGDRTLAAAIGKLRKPSTSAWAINMLVRAAPAEVDRLLELGASFRQAQDELDGAELRELTRQRQALIGAVVDQARDVASDLGRPISDVVSTEIEQTLRAAMADEGAATAVRGGALTTAISGSGLGSLNISDVAASTRPVVEAVRPPARKSAGKSPARSADEPETQRQAEQARAAKEAAERLDQAEQHATAAADRVTAAGQALEQARARRTELRTTIKELRQQLAAAEEDLAAADDAVAAAEDDRDEAKREASAAERALKQARSAASRPESGP